MTILRPFATRLAGIRLIDDGKISPAQRRELSPIPDRNHWMFVPRGHVALFRRDMLREMRC